MINNFKWAGSVCTYLLCVVFVIKFFFQASYYPPQHACFCHLSQQGTVCVWIWLNIIMLLVLLFEFHPLQFYMCRKCVHRGYVSFFRCGIYLICDRLLLPSQIACVLYVFRNPPDISRIFRLYLMIFQMTLYHHYPSIVHHQQIAKFYVLPRLYIFL